MFGISNTKNWPSSFNFDTDETCQTVFKPFIENEMAHLKAYDAERPDDITYIFHEHAQRVADNMKKTCLHIGLSDVIANNMYWAILPHDIGKKNMPLDIWDTDEKPQDSLKKYRRVHTLLGAQIVQEYFPDINHPFKDLLIDIMANHHEQIDGKGTNEINGNDLTLPVRLSAIVEAYDGWRIWRPHFENRDISIPAVIERMRAEKGAEIFDMDLFESFAEMKMMEYKSIKYI